MPPAMAATSTPDATAADGAPSLTPVTVTPDLAGSDSAPPAAPPVDSSGFYRLQGEQLQFAPNAVHAPGYSLSRDNREALELPHDGWLWFDTREAAQSHYGLPERNLDARGGLRPKGREHQPPGRAEVSK